MKYLIRFNEAVVPEEYLTPNVIREIRGIKIPEGFSIKIPL